MDPTKLRSMSMLDFHCDLNDSTGEVGANRLVASHRGLKFIIINEKYVELQGSLHKYKNHGAHNHDSFYYSDLVAVLGDLEKKFHLDLQQAILRNLEVGVNISPPITTDEILGNVLIHSHVVFKDCDVVRGNYRQARHQRYFVKIYNKGAQFDLKTEVMRFELKYVKMIDLNKIGVARLSDLRDQQKLNDLGDMLVNQWGRVLLFDPTIDNSSVRNYIRDTKLHQWKNASFWMSLTKQKRAKQLAQFKSVVSMHSTELKKEVSKRILLKYKNLTRKGGPINQI